MTPTPTDFTPEAVQALAEQLRHLMRVDSPIGPNEVAAIEALDAFAARFAQEALSTADSAICGRCGHTCFHHAMLGSQECQVPTGCDCFEFVSDKSAAQLAQETRARKSTKPQRWVIDIRRTMRADAHDWIICGIAGEFYPCKPDIFAATYEPGEPDAAPATGGTR